MKVFCFVTQKGGSGKTTLALNCAIAAMLDKSKVVIFDMDNQGTAEQWYQDREHDTPLLVKVQSNELEKALEGAKAKGFDVVFLDTAGRDDTGVKAAIRHSDFCVIPCRPTPADMKATPVTVETIRRLGKPAAFVVTQTLPRSYRIKEAMNGLSVLGMVSPINIVTRNVYQDAQGAGLGVLEYEPEGKGAMEVKKLWNWLKKKSEKVRHG